MLGEELVVYRDRRGHLGVVDKYCTHRRASLAYGVVEEDGMRCQYHGWKFDSDGQCIEQPFEDTTHPEDNFRDKCGIRAYPAQELGGLVFVYMGPEPAPLLPQLGSAGLGERVRDIAIAHLPCSWLQCQENSLDTTHTEHLHGYAGSYFQQLLNGEEPDFQRGGRGPAAGTPKIGFDAFEHGIVKRRVVRGPGREATRSGASATRCSSPTSSGSAAHCSSACRRTTRTRCTSRSTPGGPRRARQAPQQDVVPSRIVPLPRRERPVHQPGPDVQPGLPVLGHPGRHRQAPPREAG